MDDAVTRRPGYRIHSAPGVVSDVIFVISDLENPRVQILYWFKVSFRENSLGMAWVVNALGAGYTASRWLCHIRVQRP